MIRETIKLALVASVLSVATVLACSNDARQDAKTVVDTVRVLCPDLRCADAILADPNVPEETKAKLRASLPPR